MFRFSSAYINMITQRHSLELAGRVVNYNDLLNHTSCLLHQGLVGGVLLDVVVPVFFGRELDGKSVCDPMLRSPLE